MSLIKTGDHVSVLHETISGKVVALKNNEVTIEDEDGFFRVYALKNIVKQKQLEAYGIEKELIIKDRKENPDKEQLKFKEKLLSKDFIEIDLHIEVLVDKHSHLSNFEIVQIQMQKCRSAVQTAIEYKTKKLILIHGKGEGVLKSEIRHYLNQFSHTAGRYFEFYDASFNEYGNGGATEIMFR